MQGVVRDAHNFILYSLLDWEPMKAMCKEGGALDLTGALQTTRAKLFCRHCNLPMLEADILNNKE